MAHHLHRHQVALVQDEDADLVGQRSQLAQPLGLAPAARHHHAVVGGLARDVGAGELLVDLRPQPRLLHRRRAPALPRRHHVLLRVAPHVPRREAVSGVEPRRPRVPPPALHAPDRDLHLHPRPHDHGVRDHPVLLRAQQRLALEDEDGRRAPAEREQLLHDAAVLLDDLEAAGGEGLVREEVGDAARAPRHERHELEPAHLHRRPEAERRDPRPHRLADLVSVFPPRQFVHGPSFHVFQK